METLHPAVVHFAVVLPLVALTFQALFLLKSEKSYEKASLVIVVFASLFVIASYFTGSNDAHGGVAEILSTYHAEGMSELKEHAALGLYLTIAMGTIAMIKLINFFIIKKKNIDIIIALLLLIGSVMMLSQAKEGGEIVYEHGVIFEAHEIKDILKESLLDAKEAESSDETVDVLRDAIKSALKNEE